MSNPAPAWRTYSGNRAALHAPDGSNAARMALAKLRKAERAIAALAQLLRPTGQPDATPVVMFLVDSIVEHGSHADPAAGGLSRRPTTSRSPM
jgi:hypothetical protein